MQKTNITGLDKAGTYRSLSGAASENIFIGRASAAGFCCFFKVWRDMPYDAIVDYKGVLYRVEVKGSAGSSFDISRGGRSGKQIDKTVEDRKRPINRDDCDFVACVDTNNSDCYIVPVDFIEIVEGTTLSKNCLSQFKERWELFMLTDKGLSKEQAQGGLKKLLPEDAADLAAKLSVSVPNNDIMIKGKQNCTISDDTQKTVLSIWNHFCDTL